MFSFEITYTSTLIRYKAGTTHLLPSLMSEIAILILEHKNSRIRREMSRMTPDMIPTNRFR